MLYVTYNNINTNAFIGIKKKILAQCRAFQRAFGIVYYTIYSGQMMYLLQNGRIVEKDFADTKKACNEVLLQWIVKLNIKRVYIRYNLSDIWFVEFLKNLKIKNVKCILEFPSYPYESEGWRKHAIEDDYYRVQLHQYVDCCTTYSNCSTVLDIPCITLVNGVDIDEQQEKKYRKKDGSIILLAVASMAKWHGYERVIHGI